MGRIKIFAETPLGEQFGRKDVSLVVAMLLLWGLGFLTLYISTCDYGSRFFSDSLYFVKRQGIIELVGLCFVLVLVIIPLEKIRKMLPYIFFGTLILCILTFIPGISSPRNGASRWIRIPIIGETFQPSELAKITVVIFLANWFAKHPQNSEEKRSSVLFAILGLVIFVGVVLLQDDFSTGVIIFIVGLTMMTVAGTSILLILFLCGATGMGFLLYVSTSPFRLNRLIAFFNPSYDVLGSNYQTNAARTAISSGGFWGKGFGSELTQITRVPAIQTDYVFTGWVEAMGFIGVLAYFGLLLFFAWRAYRFMFECEDNFRALLLFGLTTTIVLQSVINVGVVCGALPVTGITLPFFSSGGSSLLASFLICGLMLNVVYRQPPDTDEMY